MSHTSSFFEIGLVITIITVSSFKSKKAVINIIQLTNFIHMWILCQPWKDLLLSLLKYISYSIYTVLSTHTKPYVCKTDSIVFIVYYSNVAVITVSIPVCDAPLGWVPKSATISRVEYPSENAESLDILRPLQQRQNTIKS